MAKRVLLMYISDSSGHHKASLAVEKALKMCDPSTETACVNSFNYTNPILEKIINRVYMGVIRKNPSFWGYLYDNPDVVRKTQRLRDRVHRTNSNKLKKLIEEFRADACVCTQAFPCGIVADYKARFSSDIKLYGVLTDYAPHAYWVFDKVDGYFVPSPETGEKLINSGIRPEKVYPFGIPIDPVFCRVKDLGAVYKKFGLSTERPVILMMGGSQGVGQLKDVYFSLIAAAASFDIVVVSGKNKRLDKWFRGLAKRKQPQGKRLFAFGYVKDMDELMDVSTLLISKPGGITTAEALAKGLPMLIINPIPGQEEMNTAHLIKNDVAVRINDHRDAGKIVDELLCDRDKLGTISSRARTFGHPDSAMRIARKILSGF